MKVVKRTEQDIERIIIYTALPGITGWTVHIDYHDGKAVDIPIDPSTSRVFSMLDEAMGCIKLQLEGRE